VVVQKLADGNTGLNEQPQASNARWSGRTGGSARTADTTTLIAQGQQPGENRPWRELTVVVTS
jgi:hypothetical protein